MNEIKTYLRGLRRDALPIGIAALLVLLPPTAADAQRGGTVSNVEGRLAELQRSVANLNAQLEQLKAQDRRLQKQLEEMQSKFGQRLERLEAGKTARPVPRSGSSKRQGK